MEKELNGKYRKVIGKSKNGVEISGNKWKLGGVCKNIKVLY